MYPALHADDRVARASVQLGFCQSRPRHFRWQIVTVIVDELDENRLPLVPLAVQRLLIFAHAFELHHADEAQAARGNRDPRNEGKRAVLRIPNDNRNRSEQADHTHADNESFAGLPKHDSVFQVYEWYRE